MEVVYGEDLDEIRTWQETYNIDDTINGITSDVESLLDEVVAEYLQLEAVETAALGAASALLSSLEVSVDAIVVDPSLVFDDANYEAFKAEFESMVADYSLDSVSVDPLIVAVDDAEDDFDASAASASQSVTALESALYLDDSSLSDALDEAENGINSATDYLDVGGDGRDAILGILDDTIQEMVTEANGYINFALYEVENDIGRCLPLYNVYQVGGGEI